MALPYLVDDLLADAKLRAFLPTSNTSTTSLSDADILRLANDELWGSLTPRITAAMENYFVVDYSYPIIPGQIAFDLPERASGGMLRDVYIIPAGGTQFQRRKLVRLPPEEIQQLVASPQQLQVQSSPYAFWMQGNQVVLYPNTPTADTLVESVIFRPSQMVLSSTCCQISATDFQTGIVQLTALRPVNYTTNTSVDFVRGVPGFDPLFFDVSVLDVGSSSLTFSTTLLAQQNTRLDTGDWVCLAGTACVPQIPQTLHPLLATRVALRILRAIGDRSNAEALAQDVSDMESTMYSMLTPRVQGKEEIVSQLDLLGSPYPRYRLGGI